MSKAPDIKPAADTALQDIKANYGFIKEQVAEAMDKSGRKDEVRIMAVTKTVAVDRINYAESLGINLLGENRVQEFLGKYENYSENSEIHFIGGLQNNKVKYIIDKVSMIHSVDSVKLAEEISRRALSKNLIMDILLEVNIGKELSKGGFTDTELISAIGEIAQLQGVRIRGLMTIPPPLEGEYYFPRMQELYENLRNGEKALSGMDTLSMGMSGDYALAVKYGSNIVRIGSGLFGYRNYTI